MSVRSALGDRYAARESAVHRADARVKLPAALLYILAIAFTPEGAWSTLALLAVPVALVAFAARLGPLFILRRTALALPFVAVAVPLAFTRPGTPAFELPLVGWQATEEGLAAVTTILLRSWLSVTVAVLLTASTPVIETLRALRVLGTPRLLVGTVFFTYRYFDVIGDEAVRMMRARDSRSAEVPGRRAGGRVWWRATVVGHMVGSLFARSLDRSERVYAAMQSRGFTGELRFLATPAVRGVEVAAAAAFVLAGFAAVIGDRLA